MSLWSGAELDLADEVHAPQFLDGSPAAREPDLASFKSGIADLYAAFPDFRADIRRLVVDELDATVAIYWTASGHHRAPFMGHSTSDARVHFTGIEIIRIESGKVVERWGEWDGLGVAAQIGPMTKLHR
jgi:predicted ester cyclase